MLKMVSGSTAYWVAEGKTKPISRPAMQGSSLARLKLAGVIAATDDALTNPAAEATLQLDLQRAVTDLLDESFIDINSAGVAEEQPASITHGITPIAGTGDPTTDLIALIAAFAGDLATAVFVTDPETATQIALARDAGGGFLFPDCGPRGGSLLGIPLIVSRASPRESATGQIVLIDPAAVALAMDPVRLEVAKQASLLMTDESTANAAQLVSLWQTNTVAFRAEINANWELQNSDSVAVITGATYG
jgi:HK97 family phage major capsid protein